MTERTAERKKTNGVSAKKLLIPLLTAFAILQASIIFLIVAIGARSSELSKTRSDSASYIEEATSLLAGSSLLSETCTNFVLVPATAAGGTNINPVAAYAEELAKAEHRGDQIVANFETYGVSDGTLGYLREAAHCANDMIDAQLHAIALVKDIYGLPDIPPLDSLPLPALSQKELTMTGTEKEAAAKGLVLSGTYSLNKANVSKDVNLALASLREEADARTAELLGAIGRLRALMWTITVSIILLLAFIFATTYRMLLKPLLDFAPLISGDKALDEHRGLAEVRLVAGAYNSLLKRREALDELLRSAAETDKLTGIPNRYGFEKYLLELGDEGYSLAILIFDVNYLKQTNDALGHAAGDKLLRTTAECIRTCFGDAEDCCYSRFGGDEFAAALKNVSTEKIERMIDAFREQQKRYDVSISWGYAYTDERSKTSLKALMDEADKRMYEQKKNMHENGVMPRSLREAIEAGKTREGID